MLFECTNIGSVDESCSECGQQRYKEQIQEGGVGRGEEAGDDRV